MRWTAGASVLLLCAACTTPRSGEAGEPGQSGEAGASGESADTRAALANAAQRSGWSVVCNFDAAAVGAVPTGFTKKSGEWSVVEDASSPSPTRALAQTAKSQASTFNLVLLDDVKQADVDLWVKLKPVTGEEDQGGGLVWRTNDAKNYYLARWNPLEKNFRVYKVVDGERKQLDSAKVDVGSGWREMRVTMRGESIKGWLDGRALLSARDSTFPEAGKVGLWTKSDAQTYFDDLKVGEPK